MKTWEVPAISFNNYSKKYETGIVLGGVTDVHKLPRDRVFTKQGADRILHAARLYDLGIIKNILVSGGSFSKNREVPSEAYQMKKVLLQCGIPDSVIIVEGNSKNTRENALETAKIIIDLYPNKQHLLITSAFHMRRAVGCFQKAGLTVDSFSTDFYTSDGNLGVNPIEKIYPTEEAFYKTFKVFREVLGYLIYNALGYAK
ncbi:MAG: YdcF family protein [Bacteroidota bacterium]